MKIDNNLIIICTTFIICISIIMNKLVEIVTVKNTSKIMENNFNDIIKNSDKLRKEFK